MILCFKKWNECFAAAVAPLFLILRVSETGKKEKFWAIPAICFLVFVAEIIAWYHHHHEREQLERLYRLQDHEDTSLERWPSWTQGESPPSVFIIFLQDVDQSLCNACGIRYRKKKRAIEGLKKKKKDKTTTANITSPSAKVVSEKVYSSTSSNACVHNGLSDSFKMRLMALGKEVLLQKSSSSSPIPAQSTVVKKQRCQRRRKLKEEEQAAFSLMALSCGFVFA